MNRFMSAFIIPVVLIGCVAAGWYGQQWFAGGKDAPEESGGRMKAIMEMVRKSMPKQAAPRVLTETVFSRPELINKKYIGTLEAINTVTSTTRVAGDIVNVAFQEGDLVKEGDLLFEIEDIRYRAAVDSAKARIDQIKARLKYLRATYERNKELHDQSGGVSEDEVQNVQSSLIGSEAELRSAEAALVLAEYDLRHTKIYSRITGRAGRLVYSQGNYVTPASGALITVVQMDPIYVRFSMSEKDFISLFGNVENLKRDASVTLVLPDGASYMNGGEEPIEGKIEFIDNSVKTSTDSIQIWASFPNPTEKLNAGGISQIRLTKKSVNTYPVVKLSAIMFTPRGPQVFVLGKEPVQITEGGKDDERETTGYVPERRDVVPGSSDGTYRTILSGLKDGDVVVIDGTNKIVETREEEAQPDGSSRVVMKSQPVVPVTRP